MIDSKPCYTDAVILGLGSKPMRRREFITLIGGAMGALPTLARAQQASKIPTVAYLWHAGNPDEEVPYFGAVRDGFAKLGYIDGQNFKLIHRFPNEKPEAFRSMAAELVSMNVDVLMGGGIAAAYLKEATATHSNCLHVCRRSCGN